jgi:hydroxymethylpyrimidine pyrophosphatase-like HAD family hydrolase
MEFSEGLGDEFASPIGRRKLQELKQNGALAYVTDYDGTLVGDGFGSEAVTRLIYNSSKKLIPVIATARGATFKREQLFQIIQATNTHRILYPIYISLGNGTQVLEIKNNSSQLICNNALTIDEAETIIKAYQELDIRISKEDDQIRQYDLNFPWNDLIPDPYLILSSRNPGVWIEPVKVSLLTGSTPPDIVKALCLKLTKVLPTFQFQWGGKPVIDVTKQILKDGQIVDGKLHTAQIVLSREGLSENNVAAFGDMPDGNDAGLLSLPYSYTNQTGYSTRPYSLPEIGTRVQRVHDAIYYLLR